MVPASTRELTERPSPSRRSLVGEGLLIAVLALTLNLAGNSRVGLWDRDEPRYSVAVREMRARNDWINPTFNGEPRYHKPIFIYWVMGIGTAIGGDNPFGLRLGSAVAGAATCVLTWWLGRRMLGAIPARIAAVVLATAPIMVIESKLATTDATLTFFIVLAQACLWELGRRPSPAAVVGFWTALGLSALTKGPVGLVMIGFAAAASWWFCGPLACWGRLRWRAGLGLFALVTLPWYLAIGISSGGDFYRYALGVQLLQRIKMGLEEHGGFPGYYLVCTLLTFYPWSAMVPAAALGAWTRRKVAPHFGFLLGWAVGPLILLECVKTKLIHYYLPSIPALALLVGWLISAVGLDVISLRRWPLGRLATGLLGGIGVGITACLAAASFILPGNLRWPLVMLAAILAIGTLASLFRFYRGQPMHAARILAASWTGFILCLSGWLLPSAEGYRLSRIVGEKLATLADLDHAKPVLVTFQEPGILYALKQTAPTMHDWDEIKRQLDLTPTLVTAVTPEQLDSLRDDGRFEILIHEELDGFNINKGKAQALRLARLRLKPSSLARASVEETKVK